MANTSFFTTFAMLHFTTIMPTNTYLNVLENLTPSFANIMPSNMYLRMYESLISTITDASINTST